MRGARMQPRALSEWAKADVVATGRSLGMRPLLVAPSGSSRAPVSVIEAWQIAAEFSAAI